MEDIYVLPNYSAKLSGYTKQDKTQHRWIFEAVQRSDLFPLGCKTTYRAYCSDTVIEFQKRSFADAVSPIAQIKINKSFLNVLHGLPEFPNETVLFLS